MENLKPPETTSYELTTFPRPVLPVLKGVSLRLLLSLTQNLPGQLDTPNFNVENDEKPWENKKGDAGTASISVLPVVCFLFL